MDGNIEERLNDEGYSINRSFDSEEGYRILHRLGVPPSFVANGMGVGEYDANFYSKMMNNAKVVNENNEDYDEDDNEKEDVPEKYELNNGDKNLVGYISNEIYFPIKKGEKEIEVKKSNRDGITDMPIGELFENTSLLLNNFDEEYLRALHKVDIEFGYSSTGNGYIKNMKRYFMAFIVYLQEGNNILYMGIVLFIISIILYFINIIRKND
jgi:hypothetical protein